MRMNPRRTGAAVTFLLTLITALTAVARTVSDSLVQDLACAGLTREGVLLRVRPDAFAVAQHLPLRNWKANLLGQCWGLALAQRRMFYLARTGVAGARPSRALVRYGLDLARGSQPRECERRNDEAAFTAVPCTEPATPFHVFEIPEPALGRSALVSAMNEGLEGRDLRGELERGQQRRFYDLGNLDLVLQSSELAHRQNAATFEQITDAVARGRMPLVIARFDVLTQHALLVKKIFRKDERTFGLVLYDSNRPEAESGLYYRDGLFFVREDLVIGVTIRDEEEMDRIADALLAHYRRLCGTAER